MHGWHRPARRRHSRGARRIVGGKTEARFIREQGGQAEVVPADVSDPERIEPIIKWRWTSFAASTSSSTTGIIWPIDPGSGRG
ncbi:MAG: hypothetical protein R3A10_11375 [Caldilineaceae bacterium]